MAQPAPRTIMTPARTGPAYQVTAEPVPVAFVGRTSTLALQDPRASLRRQLRSAREWLPPGWFLAAVYWDIESGGIDLEQRSQGQAYKQFTDTGLPRDGGMADLLTEACSPTPKFAAVICEDIERSGRDMFNALKLEKELSRQGIPLFATDEPADIEGVNATTVLVRRVKQGVAEWFRLQLKEKIWKGLIEHSLDGWNIGSPPYGYAAERTPHPVLYKAAQGPTPETLGVSVFLGCSAFRVLCVFLSLFSWWCRRRAGMGRTRVSRRVRRAVPRSAAPGRGRFLLPDGLYPGR
jgi:site-specific DNA recombinase